MRTKTIAKLLIAMALSCGAAYAQELNNPNNLPTCPEPDFSKKTDLERVSRWHNCWGVYKVELLEGFKGDVYKSEFRNGQIHGYAIIDLFSRKEKYVGEYANGKMNGKGKYNYADGSTYVGEWKDNKVNGQGVYTAANGDKYVGELKDGMYDGQGIFTYAKGGKQEGIWKNNTFIRAAKVNLSNLNNNIATNTDRTDIDRERQQLAEERPKYESQKNENDHAYEIFAIKPQFDWVGSFKDGLAPVRVGDKKLGKYGFINKQGRIVIQTTFIDAKNFEEGLAAVKIGDASTGKWGFIDKNGVFVISPQFDKAESFREGLSAVRIGSQSTGKTGFIDKQGNYVISPIFDDILIGFYEGLAAFRVGAWDKGKWGFIDRQGTIVIKAQFDFVMYFEDGLAPVQIGSLEDGKWGFIDRNGNFVIRAQYEWAWHFDDGLAAVQVGKGLHKKGALIDKKNNFVIQPQFGDVMPFKNELAFVQVGDDESGKWGVIDRAGKFLVNPQFDFGAAFIEEVAAVQVGKKSEAKTGYIDKSGKFLVLPQFYNYVDLRDNDQIPSFFSEGFAANCVIVNSKRKCGFISKDSIQIAQANKPPQKEQLNTSTKKPTKPLVLSVFSTQPDPDGLIVITVHANADTSSLKINGEEQGGRADGNYSIKKVARVGQDTQFTITAVDINGNTDSKTITVARQAAQASDTSIALKPEAIKRVPTRDAVAIIIGIQNYKRVPKAEFANNDAREFSEYAIRALGIKPEKIKILVDEEADEVNIVKAFENWLPIQVNKDKTDVYVFYSGHGLPAPDGKSLYFLPHGVDKELLSRTAVAQNEIVAALTAAKPKSVTMFIDACYSGQTRGGDVLIADAKPVALKTDTNVYPPNFTVITASSNDQISSSSSELKHGIFSFYLMKGMEGDADANQDGKITVGEMQDYLSDKVARQATTLGRKQNTQVVGDSSRVLVAR